MRCSSIIESHRMIIWTLNVNKIIRMHSSRMRTGRSLNVCCSLLPGGVSAQGGVCLVQGGVCLVRGVCLPGPGGGVCLVPGGSAWSRGGARRTPPVDRITDTCKNITLATTLLRPVMTGYKRVTTKCKQ